MKDEPEKMAERSGGRERRERGDRERREREGMEKLTEREKGIRDRGGVCVCV